MVINWIFLCIIMPQNRSLYTKFLGQAVSDLICLCHLHISQQSRTLLHLLLILVIDFLLNIHLIVPDLTPRLAIAVRPQHIPWNRQSRISGDNIHLGKDHLRPAEIIVPIVVSEGLAIESFDIDCEEYWFTVVESLAERLHTDGWNVDSGDLLHSALIYNIVNNLITNRRRTIIRYIVQGDKSIRISNSCIYIGIPHSQIKKLSNPGRTSLDIYTLPALWVEVQGVRFVDGVIGTDINIELVIDIIEVFEHLTPFGWETIVNIYLLCAGVVEQQ